MIFTNLISIHFHKGETNFTPLFCVHFNDLVTTTTTNGAFMTIQQNVTKMLAHHVAATFSYSFKVFLFYCQTHKAWICLTRASKREEWKWDIWTQKRSKEMYPSLSRMAKRKSWLGPFLHLNAWSRISMNSGLKLTIATTWSGNVSWTYNAIHLNERECVCMCCGPKVVCSSHIYYLFVFKCNDNEWYQISTQHSNTISMHCLRNALTTYNMQWLKWCMIQRKIWNRSSSIQSNTLDSNVHN